MTKFKLTAELRLAPPKNLGAVVSQIQGRLNNVQANVQVNMSQNSQQRLRKANQRLRKANQNMKKVGKSAKEAKNSITEFGEQAALAGKRFFAFSIATSGIMKLVNALQEGVAAAIDFQRELIRVAQVTDSTLKNLSDLRKEVTDLSIGLGVQSSELLKSSRILAQAGLSTKEVTSSLEAIAKADLAPTFKDMNSTTEGSVAIFRQFGIEAKNLEDALGAINAVSSKFAVESDDIIAAVRRTGGAFSAAGGNLNELIALFTSVRATTRESAQSIATGFRTIFTRMQRSSTQKFLEAFGVGLRDLEGQFVGPLKAIERLNEKLKEIPSTDPRFSQIVEQLGGFRQVSKVIPLIQQYDTTQRALGVAISGTTSLTEDSLQAQKSLANQIQKVREEFAAMIREFTSNESFKSLTQLALKMSKAFIQIAESLEPLTNMLTILGVAKIGPMTSKLFKGVNKKGGFGFSSGGLVPGAGNRDTVPAKLTPGEFVVRKESVQKLGPDQLKRLNQMARGGRVSPKLTTRGNAPGNVGRKKQYQTQRLDFLKIGEDRRILNNREHKELLDLKARMSYIKKDRSKRFSKRLGFGFNEGGMVPNAMLTPGEFVVNKDSASAIGKSNLNKMNKTGKLPGFQAGGAFGGVANVGFAMAGISALVSQFENLSSGMKDLLNTVTQLASQAGIFYLALKSTSRSLKEFKAEPIREAIGESKERRQALAQRWGPSKEKAAALKDTERAINQRLTQATSPAEKRSLRSQRRSVQNTQQQVHDFQKTYRKRMKTETKFIDAKQKEVDALEKSNQVAQKAAMGIAALGSMASIAGQKLEQLGRIDIEEGRGAGRFMTGKIASGAGRWSGVGAAIGMGIGSFTPLTTAGGGLIGGGIGAAAGGLMGGIRGKKEAFTIKALNNFNDSLKEAERRFKALNEGKATLRESSPFIKDYIRQTQKQLTTADLTGQGRKEIMSSVQSQMQNINQFLKKTAKSSKTLDEFENKIGSDLLPTIANWLDMPFSEFMEEQKRSIETFRKLAEHKETLVKLDDAYARQIKSITSVNRALGDASFSVKELRGNIDSIVNMASGNTSGFRLQDISNRISTPEEFFDLGQFEKIINNLLRDNPMLQSRAVGRRRTVGGNLATEVMSSAEAIRDIPSILLRFRESSEAFGGEQIQDQFMRQFEGYSRIVQLSIERFLKNMKGQQKGQDEIIKQVQNNTQEFGQKLSDVLKSNLDFSAKLSQQLTEETNIRLKYIEQLNTLVSSEIDARNRSIDIKEEGSKLLAKTGNRDVSTELLKKLDQQRQRNILGSEMKGLANDPRAIGLELERAKNRLIEKQNKLQEKRIKRDGSLIKSIGEEQEKITRLNKALKFLSNVSDRTSATMKQLGEARKTAEFKTGLVDKVLGLESPSEMRNLSRDLFATLKAATTGSITSIPMDVHSEVMAMLKSIGDTSLEAFGGRTGTDVLEQLRYDIVRQSPLISDKEAKRLAKGTSSETERLRKEVAKQIGIALKANSKVVKSFKDAQFKVIEKLNTSIDRFTKMFERQLFEQRTLSTREQLSEAVGKREGVAAKLRLTRGLGGEFEGVDRARKIAKNLSDVKKFIEVKKLQEQVGDFVSEVGRTSNTTYRGQWGGPQISVPLGKEQLTAELLQGTGISGEEFYRERKTFIKGVLKRKLSEKVGGNKDILDAFGNVFESVKFDEGRSVDELRDIIFRALEASIQPAKAQMETLPDIESNLRASNLNIRGDEFDSILKYQKQLAKLASFETPKKLQEQFVRLNNTVEKLNSRLEEMHRRFDSSRPERPRGFSEGGVVPGTGNRDTVPAMLTPGEIVLPKKQTGGFINNGMSMSLDPENPLFKEYGEKLHKRAEETAKRMKEKRQAHKRAADLERQKEVLRGRDQETEDYDKAIDEKIKKPTQLGLPTSVSKAADLNIYEIGTQGANLSIPLGGRIVPGIRNKDVISATLIPKKTVLPGIQIIRENDINQSNRGQRNLTPSFNDLMLKEPRQNVTRGRGYYSAEEEGLYKKFKGGVETANVAQAYAERRLSMALRGENLDEYEQRTGQSPRDLFNVRKAPEHIKESRALFGFIPTRVGSVAEDFTWGLAFGGLGKIVKGTYRAGKGIYRVSKGIVGRTSTGRKIGHTIREIADYVAKSKAGQGTDYIVGGTGRKIIGAGRKIIGAGHKVKGIGDIIRRSISTGSSKVKGFFGRGSRPKNRIESLGEYIAWRENQPIVEGIEEYIAREEGRSIVRGNKGLKGLFTRLDPRQAIDPPYLTQIRKGLPEPRPRGPGILRNYDPPFNPYHLRLLRHQGCKKLLPPKKGFTLKNLKSKVAAVMKARGGSEGPKIADNPDEAWVALNDIFENLKIDKKYLPKGIKSVSRPKGTAAYNAASDMIKMPEIGGIRTGSLTHEAIHSIFEKMSGKLSKAQKKALDEIAANWRNATKHLEDVPYFSENPEARQYANEAEYFRDPSEMWAYIMQYLPRQYKGTTVHKFAKEMRNVIGFQKGSLVPNLRGGSLIPGKGSGDKVPAMLEPGEFVLNRNAVQKIGPERLDRYNKRYNRFQSGGEVQQQQQQVASLSVYQLNEVVKQFGTTVDKLNNSLNSINGLEINLRAKHEVSVSINGLAVMQQLEPGIQDLIVKETNKAIKKTMKEHFNILTD